MTQLTNIFKPILAILVATGIVLLGTHLVFGAEEAREYELNCEYNPNAAIEIAKGRPGLNYIRLKGEHKVHLFDEVAKSIFGKEKWEVIRGADEIIIWAMPGPVALPDGRLVDVLLFYYKDNCLFADVLGSLNKVQLYQIMDKMTKQEEANNGDQ